MMGCREPRDLGDAFVVLTRIGGKGRGLDGVARLGRMYQRLAGRYRLDVEVLDDRRGGDPPEDVVALQVSGAGAFALLCGEAGHHQLTRGEARRPSPHREREVVRVEVLPVPPDEDDGPGVLVETRTLPATSGRLMARPRLEVTLRHEASLVTLRAWSGHPKAEAVKRLRALLQARLTAAEAASEGRPPVVRRYCLGPAPLVRDVRSGKSSGRIELIFDGELDRFLMPADSTPLRTAKDDAR
jgi:peptide chain release factor 2